MFRNGAQSLRINTACLSICKSVQQPAGCSNWEYWCSLRASSNKTWRWQYSQMGFMVHLGSENSRDGSDVTFELRREKQDRHLHCCCCCCECCWPLSTVLYNGTLQKRKLQSGKTQRTIINSPRFFFFVWFCGC